METPSLNDIKLPEPVRRIVDGVGAGPDNCGHCRQPGASKRCTRCKVVKYCSADCQKAHFPPHKKNCKCINEDRAKVDRDLTDPNVQMDIAAIRSFMFAKFLVKVGYRESDTVANGSLYYREALKYYLMPIGLLKDEFAESYPWVDDRILLLLVVLGGSEMHTQVWCMEGSSPRCCNYYPISADLGYLRLEGDDAFNIYGFSEYDLPFQAMLLLSEMKLMARYRAALQGLEAYKDAIQKSATHGSMKDTHEHVAPFLMGEAHAGKVELDILPQQIYTIIAAIRHHGHDSFLRHLKESIPLKIEHAPQLFAPSDYGLDSSFLPELWMIYQDCFFETPGLNDVLLEFIPDEDG